MKRPLLRPALLFAAGVALTEWVLPAWPVPLLAGGLCLLGAALWGRRRGLLLLAASFWAGALNYTLHQGAPAPHDLRRLAGTNATLATLRGEIRDVPTLKLVERQGRLSGRTLFRFRVEAWRRDEGAWQPATGDVAVTLRGPVPPEFFRKQRLEITGLLEPPPGPAADGLFDYALHLRHQGIWFVHQADGAHDWQLAPGAPTLPPLSDRFLPWAQRILALGLPDDETTRLIWAMALGWKTAFSGEVDDAFMESGTMHVFAISGLHIALIASTLIALLRALRLPRLLASGVVVVLVWGYVGATGWQTSAIRSALMSTIVIGGWALERPGDLLNSLAAALLAVLVWDPGQLFQTSFQLSFGVVGGMALLVPVLEPRCLKLLRFDPDPFLPDELRPRWQRWSELPLRHLALLLAASVAALLVSLPLTVHYFHLLNPVSLLANLVVVPLSGLTLTANVAALAVGGWWPGLAELFNASAWLWMRLMILASRTAADLPGGSWHVPAPHWLWWAPYYAALGLLASGIAGRVEVRRWFLAGCALVMAVAGWQGWQYFQANTITFLADGRATVVDAPGRANDLLLDTGNLSAANAVVMPYLRTRGWNRVPTLAITHGDLQHVGGAEAVLADFPMGELARAALKGRSPAYRRLLQLAETNRLPTRILSSGDRLAGWEVLHPARDDRWSHADDHALVLRRDLGGVRVLLLSDLGRLGQRALLERLTQPRTDIVVTGIPREDEPLVEPLLQMLSPQLILVTSAEQPAPERLKAVTRARLLASGARVVVTENSGAVTLHEVSSGVELRAQDGTLIEVLPR